MVTQAIEQPKFRRHDPGRFAHEWDDDDRPHLAGTIVVGGLCVR